MDKESGVYPIIIDESFQTGGTQVLSGVVSMLTTKGKLGLNTVTAANFKEILGYDLKYNPNYLGLGTMLENVSYLKVWRLNQNAKLANAYFLSKDSDKESEVDAETFDDIIQKDPKPILALSHQDVGNPQTTAVKFTPTPDEITKTNESPTTSSPQEIKISDVSEDEKASIYGVEVKGGCLFYNTSNNSIVGVIKKNFFNELKLYKVSDGEVIDDVITTITKNTWFDGTSYYNSLMETINKPDGEKVTEIVLGNVRRSTYIKSFNVWNIGDKYYDESTDEIETPSGTAGTSSNIAKAYVPAATGDGLIKNTIYATDDSGATFYTVSELGEDWGSSVVTKVSNQAALSNLTSLYNNNEFNDLNVIPYSAETDTGFYQRKNLEWFKVESFSTAAIITTDTSETNQDIIDSLSAATDKSIKYEMFEDQQFTKDNSCGSASWNETELTISMTKSISKDAYWNIHIIPSIIENWTLSVAKFADNQYTVQNTYDFSTNSESDIYWENKTFGIVQLFIEGNIPSDWEIIRNYLTLDNGSNGDNAIVASDIDTSVLETSEANVLFTNGITSYKVINKITQKAESLKIHVFGDAPAYSAFSDLKTWMQNIYKSEYLAIGARPDQVEVAADEYVYVYPSVNYLIILASMMNNYQCLNYPPAGYTYGTISVENLITCDYDNYGDELKTARINWQRVKSRGSVMWEQRTTYSLDTDLSYIAPNFILDALVDEFVTYEDQFNFRYTTPTDLLNQESGLKGILDNYVTKGFVYQYELNVPTYSEAQKSGRTLTIKIKVAIAKDSEVIYLNINLTNA